MTQLARNEKQSSIESSHSVPVESNIPISPLQENQFIALRKTPRSQELGRVGMSTADKRTFVLESEPDPEQTIALVRQGLKLIDSQSPGPDSQYGFAELENIGAYVVNAPDTEQAEAAKQVFDSDYHIIPNIRLTLPVATRFKRLPRRNAKEKIDWPLESGINLARRNGITGKGVLVGVLDTGCDADHIELKKKRIDFRYVPLRPTSANVRDIRGFDLDGHGTHVCGIIAGQNVGVAPGVDLMVASVIESETVDTSLRRIFFALDWMLSQFENPENTSKPTIISMSLGFRVESIDTERRKSVMEGIKLLLTQLVDDFDILPIVAIGNDGPGFVRAPGHFPEVLAVGAVDFQHTVCSFSCSGISPITGITRPDVVGYGADVYSSLERDKKNKSWYTLMSGTSMATPYVTGIAALLVETNPALARTGLRQHIISNALQLADPPERVGSGLARFV